MSMMTSKNRNGNHHHKRKRTTNDEPSSPRPTIIACSKCGLEVPSRNQLFLHLRTSENCSLGNNNNNNNKGREEKTVQFVKVILVLAYLGKAYHGSARNDHRDSVPTVEGCLWKAIAQALSEQKKDNDSSTVTMDASTASTSVIPSFSFATQIQENTNPKAMTRSSRTDKGVSSLGNIYSLLLPDVHDVLKDEISFTSTINHHLPSDIRLLRMHISSANSNTIPSSFDARTCCEARRYRYLIPAKALFRRGDERNEPTTESVMDVRKRLKKVLLQWGGTHSFHNFTNWKQPSAAPAPVATHDQRQNHQQKQQILNEDDGNAKEPTSHFRHILRCHVEDVIQHNHQDFLVISVKGQSFLYHQIRKMMGATIGVMNDTLPPDFIARALKKEQHKEDESDDNTTTTTIMDVPLAPAEGLVLVECIYSKYCSKHKMEPVGVGTKLLSHGSSSSNAIALCSDWKTAAAKLLKDTQYFHEEVYEQICRDQALKFSLL